MDEETKQKSAYHRAWSKSGTSEMQAYNTLQDKNVECIFLQESLKK